MAKLLGIISLILAIVLFPPAALAVISNNAVPGDSTYPIKRFLEDGIYAVASLTPSTKAWFAAARSDRRFQEVSALITQGKQAGDTLNELVEQTQIAASQINQITDQKQKEQLVNQLSQSIEKYDQGLQQLTIQPSTKPEVPQPAIVPSPVSSEPLPPPTPKATPIATVVPIAPSPTVRPTPLPTVQPTPTPLPTVEPTSKPNRQEEEKEKQRQREIEETRKRLEEIKKRLEEERQRSQKQGNRQETKKEDSNLTPKSETDKIKKEKR